MSNLHKDLEDAQIHVPKGFAAASNTTKLTKDGTGALVWATDSGGASSGAVAIHNKCARNTDFPNMNTYCQESAAGNNEHKFTIDLGASPTDILPKNTIKGAVYTATRAGENAAGWSGHVYGTAGLIVNFKLWKVTWGACQSTSAVKTLCEVATSGDLLLSGNNTPICFIVSSFTTCVPAVVVGDVFVLTVTPTGDLVGSTFSVETTVRYDV
tara:strand:+ start:2461 stop:3096 length:636 start_codon:yes stop_codon:yes gene_type:complete